VKPPTRIWWGLPQSIWEIKLTSSTSQFLKGRRCGVPHPKTDGCVSPKIPGEVGKVGMHCWWFIVSVDAPEFLRQTLWLLSLRIENQETMDGESIQHYSSFY
jgi:hypothetical protein